MTSGLPLNANPHVEARLTGKGTRWSGCGISEGAHKVRHLVIGSRLGRGPYSGSVRQERAHACYQFPDWVGRATPAVAGTSGAAARLRNRTLPAKGPPPPANPERDGVSDRDHLDDLRPHLRPEGLRNVLLDRRSQPRAGGGRPVRAVQPSLP